MNAHTGAIQLVLSPIIADNSSGFYPPEIDSNAIYQLSDQLEGELSGQRLMDGSKTLLTPLINYVDPNNEISGTYFVHGNRVIFMTDSSLICLCGK
ncbi:MAG TPA: hypothetical protein VGM92_01345 [Candidatus Kapabacteria bacterium]